MRKFKKVGMRDWAFRNVILRFAQFRIPAIAQLAMLAVSLLAALVLLVLFSAQDESSTAQAETKQIQEIEGYRTWTKVNPTPQRMPDLIARSCLLHKSPSGEPIDPKTNPHLEKFITVYVNDIGLATMLQQKNPKFAEGSVIVKEKLPTQQSQSPELLTIMIKRTKGYNPENGDWEYMVTNGSGTEVEGRGSLAQCQACHFNRPQTDYIFRTYLTNAQRENLK